VRLRIEPWRGTAFRHVPKGAKPLDTTRAGLARGRWNLPGQPTLYLASGREVAAAEWLRHLEDAGLAAGDPVPPRDLFEVALSLERTIDFRDGANQAQLSIDDVSKLVLDPVAARALATFVRSAVEAEAIWVPSVAFLDRRDQGNLVVFLDRLRAPLADLATARLVGRLTLP
jgi:RES domain-containing protein